MGSHVHLGLWPASFPALNDLIDKASLKDLADTPLVESLHGLATAESLFDVVKGRSIFNLTMDFIEDMIMDCSGRCLVFESVAASVLYTTGQCPDAHNDWSAYDAVLIPFRDEANYNHSVLPRSGRRPSLVPPLSLLA